MCFVREVFSQSSGRRLIVATYYVWDMPYSSNGSYIEGFVPGEGGMGGGDSGSK